MEEVISVCVICILKRIWSSGKITELAVKPVLCSVPGFPISVNTFLSKQALQRFELAFLQMKHGSKEFLPYFFFHSFRKCLLITYSVLG